MIQEIKYKCFDDVRYAYFEGDYLTAKFYANWHDCRTQTKNFLDSFETDRIKTALNKFYGKN
jgi:hypothetical protein